MSPEQRSSRRARHAAGPVAALAVVAVALTACGSDGDEQTGVAGAGAVTLAPSAPPSTPAAVASGTAAAVDDDSAVLAIRAGFTERRVVDAAADLEVEDQSGDGRAVRLAEATVTRGDGFVAIFTPQGVLLGSTSISPTVSPASVALDVRVPRSGELVAVLFADDGDGVFEVTRDAPLTERATTGTTPGELEDEDFEYRLR